MAEQPENSVQSQPSENIDWPQYVEYLRGLAQVATEHGLGELELQDGAVKIHLKAGSPTQVTTVAAPVVAAAAIAPAAKSKPKAAKEDLVPIVSPMVGVFFRQPSPGEPAFVEVGDHVEKGQTVGLVEAMKSFNEITAEASGIVAEIPVQNAQLVETGQPLILLKRG